MGKAKLADSVARDLEREIVAQSLPIGHPLGSEQELTKQFGVSRAVLREAIRLVEHHGVAEMRRGVGGGLFVTAPDRRSVSTAAGIWLASEGVGVHEILDARAPLLVAAVRGAAMRVDVKDVAALRDLTESLAARRRLGPGDFAALDVQIARLSGNPALVLFVSCLTDVLGSRLLGTRAALDPPVDSRASATHLRAYQNLVEAIARGDIDGAEAKLQRMEEALAQRVFDRAIRPRRTGPVVPDDPRKLGDRVASAICDEIERSGWPVGEMLGNEQELMSRYRVSRGVLREAIRILEHHGAVRPKRGPGGGLLITKPDGGAVVRAADLELSHEGVALDDLLAVRAALELECVRLAATNPEPHVREALRAALASETMRGGDAAAFQEMHRDLAKATGNRPLAFFVDVLTDLTADHVHRQPKQSTNVAAAWAVVHRAHAAIVDAVICGEVELAQRRMLRHLEATMALLA